LEMLEGLKHGREGWTFWPCNIKPRMARVIRNMAWAHQDREKRVHQTKVGGGRGGHHLDPQHHVELAAANCATSDVAAM
jgi:hypothetical protein